MKEWHLVGTPGCEMGVQSLHLVYSLRMAETDLNQELMVAVALRWCGVQG